MKKKRINRRTLLTTAATLPCAAAAYLVCKELTNFDGPPRTFGARPVPTPEPVEHQFENEYCFYAVGDTGLASEERNRVVKQMVAQKWQRLPDSIILVGDNFYNDGVQSVDDSLWQTHFEKPFSRRKFPVPFYVCLGNHDYRGSIAAQLEYSRNHPRWNMPAPYYSFTKQVDLECTVQFFVIDTNPIHEGDFSTDSQVLWLRNGLKTSSADYKIVVGHHPLYTGGEHGRSLENYRHLAKLFDQFQVDLYICGHDHDLQLHDTGRGWLHLVTGAGSRLRSVNWVATTLFAAASSGFCKVTLNPLAMSIEIFSADELIFSYQKQSAKMLARSA